MQPYSKTLVVARDALLRLDIENTLADLGHVTTFAARKASEALVILNAQTIGCAVLDWDVGKEDALAILNALAARGTPALIVSSFGPMLEIPDNLPPPPILEKPFAADVLQQLVQGLLQAQRTSTNPSAKLQPNGDT